VNTAIAGLAESIRRMSSARATGSLFEFRIGLDLDGYPTTLETAECLVRRKHGAGQVRDCDCGRQPYWIIGQE
jgi:hypothetical protein